MAHGNPSRATTGRRTTAAEKWRLRQRHSHRLLAASAAENFARPKGLRRKSGSMAEGAPLINVLAAAAQGAGRCGVHRRAPSRLPGAPGNALVRLMGKLVASEKFRAEINNKKQLTVDDSATVPGTSISVHCTVLPTAWCSWCARSRSTRAASSSRPSTPTSRAGGGKLLPSLAREVQAGPGRRCCGRRPAPRCAREAPREREPGRRERLRRVRRPGEGATGWRRCSSR